MALSDRETLRLATIIFAIAFILRASFIIAHPRPLFSDEQEYHRLASSLASTGSYSITGTPTAYRPVGYPFLLSIVHRLFQDRIIVSKIVQGSLDSLVAFFLTLMAGEISRKRGAATGLVWALFPPAIFYANLLLGETVSAFLLVLFAFIIFKAEHRALWYPLAAGAVLGMLILVKPFFAGLALLFVAAHRVFHLSRSQALLFAFSVLVVVLPWAFRNLAAMDEFTLSTNGGLNLFIGNNPQATGSYNGQFPPELADSTLNETAVEHRASQLAFEFIMHHPTQFVINGIRKMAHVFRGESELAVLAFHPDPADRQSSFAAKYRSLPTVVPLLASIPYFIVLLLALLRLIAGPADRLSSFLLLVLLSVLPAHFIFFGGSRFHFVLMPFAAVLASDQLFSIPSTLQSLSRAKLSVIFVLILGFCSLWTYEFIYLAGL